MMRNFPIGNAIRMEFDMDTSGSGIWWGWWMLAADTGMALGCQWDDLVWTGSLAVRVVWLRTIPVPVEMVKEPYGNGGGWLLSGKWKNKNYFFIICNAKIYLIRNFASWTKMKSHDMNGDGMLDCCSTWFGGSAGSFFGSRDLDSW